MSRIPIISALVGAAAGGAVAVVVASAVGGSTKTVVTTVTTPSGQASAAVSTVRHATPGLTINQIYRKVSPGVVDILVTSQTNGAFGPQTQQGEGAGVVYDQQGDILTDEHVVANATNVIVHFQDGYSAPARVLGTDLSTDVAVIRVNAPASELHPIPFANSDTAQVGDPVVAIGSPFSLPETTTAGIVSAVGRDIPAPNGFRITGAIQTDAAINPGNSGGPLLNAYGQVLGLNDQIDTNNQTPTGGGSSSGVGFATPGNTDIKIAQQIIAAPGQTVKHSWVGISLSQSTLAGAQIAQAPGAVVPNSPASHAGLRPGDTITAIDGHPVASTESFISMIANYSPGTTVTFTVKRGGQLKQISVKLGLRPTSIPNSG